MRRADGEAFDRGPGGAAHRRGLTGAAPPFVENILLHFYESWILFLHEKVAFLKKKIKKIKFKKKKKSEILKENVNIQNSELIRKSGISDPCAQIVPWFAYQNKC